MRSMGEARPATGEAAVTSEVGSRRLRLASPTTTVILGAIPRPLRRGGDRCSFLSTPAGCRRSGDSAQRTAGHRQQGCRARPRLDVDQAKGV